MLGNRHRAKMEPRLAHDHNHDKPRSESNKKSPRCGSAKVRKRSYLFLTFIMDIFARRSLAPADCDQPQRGKTTHEHEYPGGIVPLRTGCHSLMCCHPHQERRAHNVESRGENNPNCNQRCSLSPAEAVQLA